MVLLDLCIGLIVRLFLIVYGEWQDKTMVVKFTDIDYQVFTDAAQFVNEGKSPYLRSTYRYTPLLAWLLQPNIWISPLFGKLVFAIFDVSTGYMIIRITHSQGASLKMARMCGATWLLNPLPMTVSCRGNAESIMSFLVLVTLKLLQEKRSVTMATIYALSVHIKIYPVTYMLPIYFLLGDNKTEDTGRLRKLFYLFWPNRDRFIFVFSAAFTFFSLTGICYHWYGWEFVHHTYLYHITRKDIRHNFSVYFYMMYLQSGQQESVLLGLLSFIPQVILLLVLSLKFYRTPILVFFLNTFAFVTFNKVCTSQYFLWYLCLLPSLIPGLSRISILKAITVVTSWFLGQGIWLLPAYYHEFEGRNTFIYIWLAGLIFFAINCYIMGVIIENYSDGVTRLFDTQDRLVHEFKRRPLTRRVTIKNKSD